MTIASTHLSLLGHKVELTGIHYENHPALGTRVILDIETLTVDFMLISVIDPRTDPVVTKLTGVGLRLSATDDDKTPGLKADFNRREALSTLLEQIPAVQINEISLEKSQFNYRQINVSGKTAEIHFTQIHGSIARFGSRRQDSPERVQAEFVALLEKSGSVKLSIDWKLFAHERPEEMGQILAEVNGLKLSELNSYFWPQYNFRISGLLNHFQVKLNIFSALLKGEIQTDYKNFKIQLLKGPDRSPLQTWWKNSMDSIFMSSMRNRSLGIQYRSPIYYKRKKYDAFVHYLIQGAAPAIQKILTS